MRASHGCVRGAVRMSLMLGVLLLGYYLGRPIYWTWEAGSPNFGDEGDEEDGGRGELDVFSNTPNKDSEAIADSNKKIEEILGKETKIVEILGEPTIPRTGEPKNITFGKGVRAIIHESSPLIDILKHKIWEKPEKKEMPLKLEFALRREMVDFRVENNVILVTFANFAFMDFVLNWVRHLTNNGVFNILVGAMDVQILEGLFFEGVPVFDMESGLSSVDVGWGSAVFHKMGREKITLINVFLAMEYEILICDTDMVWIQNPLPWIRRYPTADVITSSDEVIRTTDTDGLEKWDRAYGAYNIGILHYRPTEVARRQARAWAEMLDADDQIWDQNGFNDLMRKNLGPDVENENGVFFAYDGSLRLGIMPVGLFCSGHTYFVQKLYKKVGMQPYAVHATFQFSGTQGKRHRLREGKLFFDLPEYYDPPGGVLTFTPNLPDGLLTAGKHTLESHFALVNHQFKQIRSALAIATILGRTLVFPPIWVRFDTHWFPHSGMLIGTETAQPFLAPLDHVFLVDALLENFPESEYGPKIVFREYSFLQNPRLPGVVANSKISIRMCKRGREGCPTSGGSINEILFIPKKSTQNELLEIFKPLKHIKILDFSTMINAFGGWDDKDQEAKFNARIKRYTSIWCCVNANPGHIYYDIFADQKKGWLPKPPTNRDEDHHPL